MSHITAVSLRRTKMKKQLKAAPRLSNMQIKALVGRMIEEYNKAVTPILNSEVKKKAEREKEWKVKLRAKLAGSGLTPKEKDFLVGIMTSNSRNDDPFEMDKIVPHKISEHAGSGYYKPDHWGFRDHPAHKLVEDFRFKLIMATAENFEPVVEAFKAEIAKALKQ